MVELSHHISAIDASPDISKEKPPVDLGDSRSVKEARREARTAVDIARDTLRGMMTEEKNRKWFCELLTKCHILRNPFSRDSLSMAFDCGEMNIGQQIFIQLQDACPDLYLKMMEENNG